MKQSKIFLIFVIFCSLAFGEVSEFLIKPTGHYKVSVREYLWQNSDICPDYFYNKSTAWFYKRNPNHCHLIDVYIYYPTTSNVTDYNSYWSKNIIDLDNDIKNNVIESRNLATAYKVRQIMLEQKGYIMSNQKIAAREFPLIIFQPGLGFNSYNYQNYITNLVSNGYIVIAIDSAYNQNIIESYGTLPIHIQPSQNGKLSVSNAAKILAKKNSNLALALADYKFVINKLKSDDSLMAITSHIDYSRVGGLGHSLGSTSMYINSLESGTILKAFASLDIGSSNDKPKHLYKPAIPTIFLRAANDKEFGRTIGTQNEFYLKNKNQYLVIMSSSESNTNYSTHRAFTDMSTTYYNNTLINLWYKAYGQPDINLEEFMYSKNINGAELTISINQYLLDFFDQYLKSRTNPNFKKCIRLNSNSILHCGAVIIR